MLQQFLILACRDYVEMLHDNHQNCDSLVYSDGCGADITLLNHMSGKVKYFCPASCNACDGRYILHGYFYKTV